MEVNLDGFGRFLEVHSISVHPMLSSWLIFALFFHPWHLQGHPQQVELDLSYATPCKKVYQRYKVYGQMHMDKMKAWGE